MSTAPLITAGGTVLQRPDRTFILTMSQGRRLLNETRTRIVHRTFGSIFVWNAMHTVIYFEYAPWSMCQEFSFYNPDFDFEWRETPFGNRWYRHGATTSEPYWYTERFAV